MGQSLYYIDYKDYCGGRIIRIITVIKVISAARVFMLIRIIKV